MIKRIRAKLKTHGVRGVTAIVLNRLFPRRSASFKSFKPLFLDKVGLEIGGPSGIFKREGMVPLYPLVARIDNCNFGRKTVWEGTIKEGPTFFYHKRRAPGNQYVVEATDLRRLGSESYDFVLSSHTIEHTANPIRALKEWIRVLKPEGLLVFIVPHKDGTFDHRRPVTRLDHIVEDFDRQMPEDDLTHLEEILKLHDLGRDPWAGGFDSFKQRSMNNLEHRCLHHHVFDTQLAINLVDHMGLQILFAEAFEPCNILVVAQKPKAGNSPDNGQFTTLNGSPKWHSPFPSDRPATTRHTP